MNIRQHNVQQLGEKFVAGLEATLTPAKIRAVAAINERYRLAGGDQRCATRNFCGSDRIMLEAFQDMFPRLTVRDIFTSDFQMQLLADGWEAAKTIIRARYLHQSDTMPEGFPFIMSVEWDQNVTVSHVAARQFIPALLSRPPWTTFEYGE